MERNGNLKNVEPGYVTFKLYTYLINNFSVLSNFYTFTVLS